MPLGHCIGVATECPTVVDATTVVRTHGVLDVNLVETLGAVVFAFVVTSVRVVSTPVTTPLGAEVVCTPTGAPDEVTPLITPVITVPPV